MSTDYTGRPKTIGGVIRRIRRRARKAFDEEPPEFAPNPIFFRKIQFLRQRGYLHQAVISGVVKQGNRLRKKSILVLLKTPMFPVHGAAVSEKFIRQDMSNVATIRNHEKYPILDDIAYLGAPAEDFLVLTWEEFMASKYAVGGGEWIVYHVSS